MHKNSQNPPALGYARTFGCGFVLFGRLISLPIPLCLFAKIQKRNIDPAATYFSESHTSYQYRLNPLTISVGKTIKVTVSQNHQVESGSNHKT